MFAALREMLRLGGRPLVPAALALRSRHQLPDDSFVLRTLAERLYPSPGGITVLPDSLQQSSPDGTLRSIHLHRNQLRAGNGDRLLSEPVPGLAEWSGNCILYMLRLRLPQGFPSACCRPALTSAARICRKLPRPSEHTFCFML